MAEKLTRLLVGLKDYYSQPLVASFKRFRAGVIYFAVGLMTIFMAHTYMEASWQQELAVLSGLIMAALGFFLAMLAHMRMIISRILSFFTKR